jgi:uncharacterized protein (DUF433 family)
MLYRVKMTTKAIVSSINHTTRNFQREHHDILESDPDLWEDYQMVNEHLIPEIALNFPGLEQEMIDQEYPHITWTRVYTALRFITECG